MARCLNGGACINGKCECLNDYEGDFCEINSNKKIIFKKMNHLDSGGFYSCLSSYSL